MQNNGLLICYKKNKTKTTPWRKTLNPNTSREEKTRQGREQDTGHDKNTVKIYFD